MDLVENIKRIKDNLLLIPASRFDGLVKDKDYTDSFIYFIACIILSIPFALIIGYVTGSLTDTVLSLPVSILISIILAYAIFGIQHLLLKLLGGKANFLQSVQVFIYGSTPSVIFGSLPLINIISSLVGLANVIVGAAQVHKISLIRTIAAILIIPTILLILLFVAVYAYLAPA